MRPLMGFSMLDTVIPQGCTHQKAGSQAPSPLYSPSSPPEGSTLSTCSFLSNSMIQLIFNIPFCRIIARPKQKIHAALPKRGQKQQIARDEYIDTGRDKILCWRIWNKHRICHDFFGHLNLDFHTT